MYTDKELEELEKEEESLSEEALAALLFSLGISKSEIEKAIRDFYSRYGKDGVVTFQEAKKWISNKNHLRRYIILSQFVEDTFDASFVAFEETFRKHLRDVILKESNFFGVKVDVDDLLDLVWGTDGLNWKQRLWAHYDKWTSVLNGDLKKAFLKRESIFDVLKTIGGRYESMEKILDRLCVTETTATATMTRKEIFKQKGIKSYRFYTQADERTCETCGSMHGRIFPMVAFEIGVSAPPLHPRCRCFITEPQQTE